MYQRWPILNGILVIKTSFRERLAEKRARVQQIVKEAAELDNIVQSDTQSKLNLLGSFCYFGKNSETCI